MNGSLLRFYVHENQRHEGHLVWEWLLSHANRSGIRGGSAFKATGGFGHQHQLAERRPFDLVDSQTVEIEFLVSDREASMLLDWVREQNLRIFYATVPARFGICDPDQQLPQLVTKSS